MVYKSRQTGETGFPMQTYCIGGEKTVGDQPTDPSPKDGHRVQDGWGGALSHRSVQENRGQERVC